MLPPPGPVGPVDPLLTLITPVCPESTPYVLNTSFTNGVVIGCNG